MILKRYLIVVGLAVFFVFTSFGKDEVGLGSSETEINRSNILGAITSLGEENYSINRLKLVGAQIKTILESYHFGKNKLDDAIAKKAFVQYLKKIDYGKQFLLKSDVQVLKKYELQMDDEVISGDISIVDQAQAIIKQRIKSLEDFRKEIFNKSFDMDKDEFLEVDSDKRDYKNTEKELKDHWRKVFKYAVVLRYLTLKDDQDEITKDKMKKHKDVDKDKIKKKKKKEKILTDQQLRKKAKEDISKKYEKLFSRMLKDDKDDYLENFYNSITSGFDPHTNYMPPKRKEDFDIDISGSLEGIGAVLQEDDAYIKVVKIIPGGAAWREKQLEADDLILAVAQKNGEFVDLTDMKVDDAVRYIRGKKGTVVRLRIKKYDSTIKTISIVRDVVQIGESYAKSSVITSKKLGIKVGYILVPKFYRDFENDSEGRNCTEDVRRELEILKARKVDGVIIDLRSNGGGSLEDARKMSGLFIEKGPIVQVKGHDGEVNIMSDKDATIVYGGPLIVMTNMFSASASEILAGAMQDYERAIVVGGEYSHGKGTVQAVLNMNPGPLASLFGPSLGAIKITIQKFYRITGESTQYKGIIPDIALPDSFSYSKSREQDLDNSLVWDEIQGLKYEKWNKSLNNSISLLKQRSSERVQKNPQLQKIIESIKYLTKKREDTLVSLKISKTIEDIENNKKIIETFKDETKNTDLSVSSYEDSLKISTDQMKKVNQDKWKKDFEKRKNEWVEALQGDAVLGETINILKEMVMLLNEETLLAK